MAREFPTDKSAARRLIRAGRTQRRAEATEQVWRELAAGLAEHVDRWLAHRPAPRAVALYESLPTEPPMDAVAELLRANGIRVLTPELLPDKDLSWRDRSDTGLGAGLGLDLGRDGIGQADVVLVPALAIGRDGTRLGQGGGSYDRVLPRVAPGIPVLAVVFDEELVDAVPSEPHDRRVDGVLTPSGGVRDLKY
ncbi:5-formyltetrahydrofolate cyclo-ligase [Flexivirga meconopsidis]|uniref:5-formyltetrahydrofolate cyclo-ligase n=1 Tax=Flexivirga meconopsidis TaxID=2977121 RepID=UPI00223FF54D|nr:5-formyltetrahydrofolate cyclo-ligase [Flexivirga meconopsidis]